MDEKEKNTAPAEENLNDEISEILSQETSADEEDTVSEYNDLMAKIADLEEKFKEENEKYVRLYAEYENYRKRTEREKLEIYANASAKCIENMLPVIDSFERSLESECADENFKKGMDMIYNQFKGFFSKMNVTEIEALGAEFDPNFHNAVQQLSDTDYAANHVCAVHAKGYMIGDKLIRPAMVAVAD